MLRRTSISGLRQAAPIVLPSLLLCDFGNLEREVERLELAGVGGLHLDVMDGNFVPNFTYGMPIVAALRKLTDLTLDVHLMIDDPGRYVEDFYEAGADLITIHIESTDQAAQVLQRIRNTGAAAGLAINPQTPLSRIQGCVEFCDLVLVMSVEAGFGGQSFDEAAIGRLRQVKEMASPECLIEVDGGINRDTIGACADAGAKLFVVGSAIFGKQNYTVAIAELASCAVIS